MRLHLTLSALLALASLRPSDAEAADRIDARPGEILFPEPGRVALTASTGVPFLGIGEVAVGVTDGFAVGAIAGVTPLVSGFGVRVRGILLEGGAWRLSAVAPVLLYPRTSNTSGPPWTLVRANVMYERILPSEWRLNVGVGLIGAATLARLNRTFGAKDYSDGAGGLRPYGTDSPATAGLWGTISAGATMPLGPRWSLFADAGLVFERAQLAGSSWIGGVPVTATLGSCFRL
jgi:hypothetical protein